MNNIILFIGIVASLIVLLSIMFLIILIRAKVVKYENNQYTIQKHEEEYTRNNIVMYSLVIQVSDTININRNTTDEYNILYTNYINKSFNIPHICGNKIESISIVCNDIAFIAIKNTFSSSKLVEDIQTGSVCYVLINNQLYFVHYNIDVMNNILYKFPIYNSCYIIALYTIQSSNISSSCVIDILPFWGALSTTNAFNILNLNMKYKEFPFHLLGYTIDVNV